MNFRNTFLALAALVSVSGFSKAQDGKEATPIKISNSSSAALLDLLDDEDMAKEKEKNESGMLEVGFRRGGGGLFQGGARAGGFFNRGGTSSCGQSSSQASTCGNGGGNQMAPQYSSCQQQSSGGMVYNQASSQQLQYVMTSSGQYMQVSYSAPQQQAGTTGQQMVCNGSTCSAASAYPQISQTQFATPVTNYGQPQIQNSGYSGGYVTRYVMPAQQCANGSCKVAR